MITLDNETKSYKLSLPTSLKEITPEVFKSYLKDVKLPDNYVVVALAAEFKLGSFLFAMKPEQFNGNVQSSFMLLAKKDNENKVKFEIGDKLIANRTDIEMSTHLNVSCACSVGGLINYLGGKNAHILKGYNDDERVYLLSFKIFPLTGIRAAIAAGDTVSDPFVHSKGN